MVLQAQEGFIDACACLCCLAADCLLQEPEPAFLLPRQDLLDSLVPQFVLLHWLAAPEVSVFLLNPKQWYCLPDLTHRFPEYSTA